MQRRLVLDASGRVGINLGEGVEAEALLHVAGTAKFDGSVEVEGSVRADSLAVGALHATAGISAASIRGLGLPAGAVWETFQGQACSGLDAATNRSAVLVGAASPGECRAECLLIANCTAATWLPNRATMCYLSIGACERFAAAEEEDGMQAATVHVKPQMQELDLVRELVVARAQVERMNASLAETRAQVERMNATLAETRAQVERMNATLMNATRTESENLQPRLDCLAWAVNEEAFYHRAVNEAFYNRNSFPYGVPLCGDGMLQVGML